MNATSYSKGRRALLARATGVAMAAPWVRSLEAAEAPYGPFKVGIQSYSLRGFDAARAMSETAALGLKYWESYPAHVALTNDPEKAKAPLAALKAAGISLTAFGVVAFKADAAANRNTFECAKTLGIRNISADPDPASFSQLDELVEEFKINIGIHNHGPKHRYGSLQQCLDAIHGRHKRFGICVDTGHFLRSGEDPVKVIEAVGARVYGVHLKDVKDKTRFTILGEGDMNVVGVLKALKSLKYRELVALEYEENPQNPLEDLRKCLANLREAVEKI